MTIRHAIVLVTVAAVVVALGSAGGAPTVRTSSTPPSPSDAPRRSSVLLQRRHLERRRRHLYPLVLDDVALGLLSGASPYEVVTQWSRHPDVDLRALSDHIDRRLRRGDPLLDACEAFVVWFGPSALTLVGALRSNLRNGIPLTTTVERLADDAREQRRREAEVRARELPVRLSFPLVICTLPSFVLIAIVPLLVGALRDLRPH